MDSCMELHSVSAGQAAARKQALNAGDDDAAAAAAAATTTAPSAGADDAAAAAPESGGIADHMLLLDLGGSDDEDAGGEGALPGPPPRNAGAGAAHAPLSSPLSSPHDAHAPAAGRSGPIVPTGFTPAEAYVDRAERTVFFAKISPAASADAVSRVFEPYGAVEEVNLFRQW